MKDSIYKIALSMLPGIGPRIARNLVSYVGSVEGIFKEKSTTLEKIPGIGKTRLAKINFQNILDMAEAELTHILSNEINWLFYLDKEYPSRLIECDDAPVILYFKGENCFEAEKMVSVVGTRNSTEYGDSNTQSLIAGLAGAFPDLVVVSGFAYGIDISAHKAALEAGLKTIAVFGTGLRITYPTLHKRYLKGVINNGCICSEFHSGKKADPGNFVSRNRIIAGLADATIVVESGEKGGALLTADMANSYHRDVFAYPGRISDSYSKGCNNLIKNNQAMLIESTEDLILSMRWDATKNKKPIQPKLFQDISPEESLLIGHLNNETGTTIDELAKAMAYPVSKISAHLLNLEFKGFVKALPGKSFRLNE
jgi:DNA processing protein